MATLIKNGTLITATDTFEADILVEGEKISLIGKDLRHPNAEVIDAAGRLIMPGGIDPHVHLDLPMFGTVSSDDHYTGHKAAAFGGTTTVMDFVVLDKEGFQHSVDTWMKMAEKAAIDGATMRRHKTKRMNSWQNLTHYAGFDWAKDHHAVLILNHQGAIVADFEFEHSLEGWKSFTEKTSAWPNLAVAIETSQGAAVDQLLQRE